MQEFIDGQGRLKEKVLLVKGEKKARQRELGLMELVLKEAWHTALQQPRMTYDIRP